MVAQGFGLDDKVSKAGDVMSGTLAFQGTPPFTVVKNAIAGTATTNGTNGTTWVTVATSAADANSVILLTAQPGGVPVGTLYVGSITAGSGFTFASTSSSDTALVVGWYIIEHS